MVIVAPGPDIAVAVRSAPLSRGLAGTFTALGISTGQAVWAFATSFGFVALLVALGPRIAAEQS
ncbi:MAG: hypothetical protein ACREEP_16925 [Dongiaceae bacterium]